MRLAKLTLLLALVASGPTACLSAEDADDGTEGSGDALSGNASAFVVGDYWTASANPIAQLRIESVSDRQIRFSYSSNDPRDVPGHIDHRNGLLATRNTAAPTRARFMGFDDDFVGDGCIYELEARRSRGLTVRLVNAESGRCNLLPTDAREVSFVPHTDLSEQSYVSYDGSVLAVRRSSRGYVGRFTLSSTLESTTFPVTRPTGRVTSPNCELALRFGERTVEVRQNGACLTLVPGAERSGAIAPLGGTYRF